MSQTEIEIIKPPTWQRNPHEYYPPEKKAEAIALAEANGGNLKEVERLTGIAYSTLQYWIANKERFTELRQERVNSLLEKLDNHAHLLADAIPGKISSATLSQTAHALGVVIDKSQLLRGLPTTISESVERQDIVVILQSALAGESGQSGEVQTAENTPLAPQDMVDSHR